MNERKETNYFLNDVISRADIGITEDEGLSVGGEEREIFKSFELESAELFIGKPVPTLKDSEWYGNPLSLDEAREAMPEGGGGLLWNSLVVPNKFFQEDRLKKGLSTKDFDVEKQTVKPRRPSMPITSSDLFSSLTKIPGLQQPRWIFHGVLNGWPALTCLELVSLQSRRTEGLLVSARDFITGRRTWMHHWRADLEGKEDKDPEIIDDTRIYRAKLRGAPWTSIGWSKDSPGFVFWYEPMHPGGSRLKYGTDLVEAVTTDDICTAVHMVSHRYAVARESPKDKLTYHSIVLMEWDHGMYCTVVEGAFLNGLGGYNGKSNWFEDKDEPVTAFFRALPSEMIGPWLTNSSEVRCFDVQARSLDEFKAFVEKYEGKASRFVDPHYTFSHVARLSYRTKKNVAQYLLNYTGRDCTYDELKRNCQTFAADLCSFLAGKKSIEPFHPANRIAYVPRPYLFLYDSRMYESTKRAGRKKKFIRE